MDFNQARQYALRRLSQQALTKQQLYKAIIRKGATEEVAEQVIEKVDEYGYLDDVAWAEGFVRGQCRKGFGPRLIQYKLKEKGISPQIAAPFLEKAQRMQSEQIRTFLEKKRPDLTNIKIKQRVFSNLVRKGYDIDAIQEAINLN
jgi:regulatory protein